MKNLLTAVLVMTSFGVSAELEQQVSVSYLYSKTKSDWASSLNGVGITYQLGVGRFAADLRHQYSKGDGKFLGVTPITESQQDTIAYIGYDAFQTDIFRFTSFIGYRWEKDELSNVSPNFSAQSPAIKVSAAAELLPKVDATLDYERIFLDGYYTPYNIYSTAIYYKINDTLSANIGYLREQDRLTQYQLGINYSF
ncbi:hypothetical protein [Paraferrimonas haliotis]|uniref:Uncharacterized protein n=1 Tax=Paraferrimonas haliotis TaxID=2013866 RepID=A0AA37WWE0_9GAMM|nr:hypothetical protein [Paraferrimonas haliotis]GLS83433.1 hypothetical protein GCM10007894_14100 [Paraferrimonas haliotis]